MVSLSVLSSVLFCTIGFISGCYCQRRKRMTDGTSSQPAPLYDTVHVLQQDINKRNIELRENVAYGQV